MKKNKKVALSKKPFLVLSRRAIAGWLGVIFILCAWMFVIGVLVGRGTAPVKFRVDGLQSKLEISRRDFNDRQKGPAGSESDLVKDKSKLDFYEALPEDREDTNISEKKPGQVIIKKVEPLPDREPPPTTAEKAAKKSPPREQAVEKEPPKKKQPAKQPVAAKSKAEPTGIVYTVQVAAVKAAKDADLVVAQLKKKGYPAYRTISKVQGKGIWFRVRVGKYNSVAAARSAQDKLTKSGLKPIIVQVEK